MSYNAVPSKNTGDTWTATENNIYLRDNFASSVPDLFTTKGDMVVATGADAGIRLAAGTNDLVFTADSAQTTGTKWARNPVVDIMAAKGDIVAGSAADTIAKVTVGANGAILMADSGETAGVKWVSMPVARYETNAGQTINNDTITIINFEDLAFDTASAVTVGAAWKFTVPAGQTGYYFVNAMAMLASDAGWEVGEAAYLAAYVDAANPVRLTSVYPQAAGTFFMPMSGSCILYAAAASYIDVRIYQNSDNNIALYNNATYNRVCIARLF